MYDIESCSIEASKHFRNKYMRKWNWDYKDLRDALREAHIGRVGKDKFEAVRKGKEGSKKIIFVYYKEFETIFVISGSEGGAK